jgi:hypothetical protein
VLREVPAIYYKDLLRGLIDSDGTISFKNRYRIGFALIASDSVLDFFNVMLFEITQTKYKYKRIVRHASCNLVKSITLGGAGRILFVLDYLYRDANIFLDRKYKLYKDILNNTIEMCQNGSGSGTGCATKAKHIKIYTKFLKERGEIE